MVAMLNLMPGVAGCFLRRIAPPRSSRLLPRALNNADYVNKYHATPAPGTILPSHRHRPVVHGRGNPTALDSALGIQPDSRMTRAESTQMQSGNRAPVTLTGAKPLQIRGRFITAIAVHLVGAADDSFWHALDTRLAQTPRFFDQAPLVIDLEQAADIDSAADLARVVGQLRARHLAVFAVQSAAPEQARMAQDLGLISLPAGREAPVERMTRQGSRPAAPVAPAPPPAPVNKLITHAVRSGQTVFADRGDLTILGSVSSGAEIIAAGNIHVYGRLRGRALAGVNGDTAARIFCHHLDAELLAIAGLYRTSESLAASTPREYVQVFLDGDQLRIQSLI